MASRFIGSIEVCGAPALGAETDFGYDDIGAAEALLANAIDDVDNLIRRAYGCSRTGCCHILWCTNADSGRSCRRSSHSEDIADAIITSAISKITEGPGYRMLWSFGGLL